MTEKVVNDLIFAAFQKASDDDIKLVVRNLSRLVRSPEYEDLDPGRKADD